MSQKKSKGSQHYGIQRLRRAVFETPTGRSVKTSGYEYIKYGDDNKYPIFLENLLQQPEHNAILDAKTDWIGREGFDIESLPSNLQSFFIENDMNTFVYKLARDYELYGGFSFYVIQRRDGAGVASLEYEDFGNIRVPNDDMDELLVSEKWDKIRTTEVERVPAWEKGTTTPKTLYYFTDNCKDVYPTPKYYGGIPAIQTGVEIDNFHLNHVKNGFFIPLVINFNNGIPDKERQDEIVRDVKGTFSGTDNAGEPLISFNENKDSQVQIESFEPADLDKKFEVLDKRIEDKIFHAHRITSPMLFGVREAGQLGGRTELVEAWEIFQTDYIRPRQMTLCGVIKTVLGIEDIDLYLMTRPPIEPEVDKDVLSIEERRKLQGIEDEDVSEQQKTIMAIKQLPAELQKKFVEQLTPEEVFNLVGYERISNEIDTEDI